MPCADRFGWGLGTAADPAAELAVRPPEIPKKVDFEGVFVAGIGDGVLV
jgi:hypothetical protein